MSQKPTLAEEQLNVTLIARRQRQLLWGILFIILMNVGWAAANTLNPIGGIWVLIQMILQATLVVRLAIALGEHPRSRWFYGFGAILPLIGLLLMLILNQKATTRLRDAGFRVGFMGANMSDINAAQVNPSGS